MSLIRTVSQNEYVDVGNMVYNETYYNKSVYIKSCFIEAEIGDGADVFMYGIDGNFIEYYEGTEIPNWRRSYYTCIICTGDLYEYD